MIGNQIQIISELLIDTLDLRSTERVLDVATGSGNAASAVRRKAATGTGAMSARLGSVPLFMPCSQ